LVRKGCHLVCHGGEACVTVADDGVIDHGMPVEKHVITWNTFGSFGVVLRVDIRFIPALEAAKPFMMDGRARRCVRNVPCVTQELRTDKVDVFRRVEEAVEHSAAELKPLPSSTKSSRAFSCSGVIFVVLA